MKAPGQLHTVRPVDVFVKELKKEMMVNSTTDLAPMIGLLILPEGENFDRFHPEAYLYETLGGKIRGQLFMHELCKERPELLSDNRFRQFYTHQPLIKIKNLNGMNENYYYEMFVLVCYTCVVNRLYLTPIAYSKTFTRMECRGTTRLHAALDPTHQR